MTDDLPDRRTEHTLLSTDDAVVWAEEFCRIFSGKMIAADSVNDTQSGPVTPVTMVTWFANAMETAVALREKRAIQASEAQQDAFVDGFTESRE